ncbi:MAG: radical SAM-associated putative lipoprotein [Tannerellaceae bacterium]|nr:radical SAM-associated putative lipoprotein [Tannerellaceae bacterium]
MEKKITFKKLLAGFLSTLLAVLGFGSCNSGEDDPYVVMYAPGPSVYKVKGKVVEKDNTEHVLPGIQVVAYPVWENGEKELPELSDTIITDANGRFLYPAIDYPTVRLIFEDINKPEGENPIETFAKDTVDIDVRKFT